MSTIKTLTAAVTAAALVSGIGLAVAQSEETPAAPPVEQTVAAPLPADQTPPADPAVMPQESNAALQQPADDPNRVTPPAVEPSTAQIPPQPVDNTVAKPATQIDNSSMNTTTTTPAYTAPAPRADRN